MLFEATTLISIGKQLATLIAKPGAEAVLTKISMLKNEKDTKELRAQYEEIIFRLLDERNEALNIARVYQEKIESIEISESDIESLHKTISGTLDVISGFSQTEDNEAIESFGAIQSLITIDTLRALQLIGFNYKEAIGETLTKITKTWIERKLSPSATNANPGKRR